MPIFGSHSSAATPPKARLISAPMHARHVGGVSITGGTGGNATLDSYFAPTSLEPDELPSHTYAAYGKVEVPGRSNTFTNVVRKPSLSLKRSVSRIRSASGSRGAEGHKRSQSENHPTAWATKSDSSTTQRIGRKPSPKSVHPNIGIDLDAYEARAKTQELDSVPNLPPRSLHVDSKTSMSSLSEYSVVTDYEQPRVKGTSDPLPVRPVRADSGTAIEFNDVPVEERPIGFKEIAAMQSFKDRIALYKKTRDYWANAEHGLAEWTGRTGGPRTVQLRREGNWL